MEKVFIDGLSFAMPLFIMAIGGIYSEKSGVTNLAVEGFQGFGAFIGAAIWGIGASLGLNLGINGRCLGRLVAED